MSVTFSETTKTWSTSIPQSIERRPKIPEDHPYDRDDSDLFADVLREAKYHWNYRDILEELKEVKKREVAGGNEDLEKCFAETNRLLSMIQAAFGVSCGQLAEMIHVKRHDIFAWTRRESIPFGAAMNRLFLIARFAEEWNALLSLPTDDALFEPNEENVSLFQLLKDDILESEAIRNQMNVAAEKAKSRFEEIKKVSVDSSEKIHGSMFDLLNVSAYRQPEEQ